MKTRVSTSMYESDRRAFIGGSDARIIMGDDEAALVRLWREKRGEVEPEDLRQPDRPARHRDRDLNRHWYERNTGQVVTEVQRQVFHPVSAGWRQPWTAWSRGPARSSRPSSCCPGRSRRRRPPRSTWRSCSTTCG